MRTKWTHRFINKIIPDKRNKLRESQKINIQNMINEQLWHRLEVLMMDWRGKENHRIEPHIITEIFNVHNGIFPEKPEYSKSCGGCVKRVWDRLTAYYDENKHLY